MGSAKPQSLERPHPLRIMRRFVIAMLLAMTSVFYFLVFISTPVHAEEVSLPFDHSEWDQFLKKFVNEKGEVNYRAALKERRLLRVYLKKLRSIPAEDFNRWPREERVAIFVNAFNAGVIQLILKHYPVQSFLDIPGAWDQPVVRIGTSKKWPPSKAYSLNQLQNGILRRQFRDEKIVFALSTGAKGSPRLRQEAYVGPRLEGQLYTATREFVNDETRNQIVPGNKKIVLSRLFKWYGNDFLLNWGNFPEEEKWDPQEMAVLSFFAHYLEDPKKVEFLKEGKYKVKYDVFDWRLNDWLK